MNRVVVITGATGGLGQVVTKHFADQGAKLVLLGRSKERLSSLSDGLDREALNYLSMAVDLTNPKASKRVVSATLEKFGKIDILLQLVGGWTGGQTVPQLDLDEVSNMLQQHLWTTLHLAQAFVPYMLKNEWGRMVAVSSPFAASPRAKGAPYAIGKAAQEALLLTLAQELKGSGVTANLILVKSIDLTHKRDRQPSPKNASWSTPEEITEAIQYLVSDEARMVNGARIPLYGSP
jgi:NADP-dependent 3-hydroxy acid dehydrogenase YdfG